MSGADVNLSWEVIQSRWRRLTVARVQIKRPLNTRLELFMCNQDFQVKKKIIATTFFCNSDFQVKTKMLQKLFIFNSDYQFAKNCKNFLSAILTLKIKKDTLQLTTKKQNFLLGVDTI